MDNRLFSPGFITNNLEYLQKELEKQGLKLVKVNPSFPGEGVTYETVALGA